MALGSTALKTLLGFTEKGIRMEDFHGTVTRDPSNRFWVVPTFHPSHLQRGAMNLFGVVSFDMQVALGVARDGWELDEPSVVVDPSVAWFAAWVETVEAAATQDPLGIWLVVDIETPDKSEGQDEGQLSAEDRSYIITRVNFSVHPDEGISVPYMGPYIALIDRLLKLPCPKILWNKEYDQPRLEAAGHPVVGDWYDFMWAWHHLQSDVPRGLGFAAPFYSRFGAWKHLGKSHPGYYAACDGFQTFRTATGIATDLQALGMWDTFARHTHLVHQRALHPAQILGVKIDRQRLEVFVHDLEVKQRRLLHQMQGLVPEDWRALTPKAGLKTAPKEGAVHTKGRSEKIDGTKKKDLPDPLKQELYAQVAVVVRRDVEVTGHRCTVCHQVDVTRTHRCDKTQESGSVLATYTAPRWFWQEPFNPDSPPQILDYLKRRGHKPGRARKTGADSTDRETLNRLARETKDPLYQAILDVRAVGKVRGTYGIGTQKRLDQHDRIHPVPTFKPSTHRLSYVNPNITNVITDRGGAESLAAGFRACVVADQEIPEWSTWDSGQAPAAPAVLAGTRLAEFDFSGIEAVLSGYFMQDAHYVWLAKLGVHAGLASYILKRPYDPAWSTADIAAYFALLKKTEPVIYDRAKRCVHGSNYGLTIHGMVRNFPQTFPTLKVAKAVMDQYHLMAPGLPKWHQHLRERAYAQNFLGGPGDHPFGYKHWFWSVLGFRQIPYSAYLARQRRHDPVTTIQGKYFAIQLGDDAKRVVAFYPQSTAAGILKEVMLRLFDPDHPSYIGDTYYGRTPFRAPIHDSLLLEIPNRVWDRVCERVYLEMTREVPELPLASWIGAEERGRLGLGEYLSIGVAGKCGHDWMHMEGIPTPQISGVAADNTFFAHEAGDDEDEAEDLATTLGGAA